jgi:hypothetical protein
MTVWMIHIMYLNPTAITILDIIHFPKREWVIYYVTNLSTNLCGFSPRANYTDRVTAACRRG